MIEDFCVLVFLYNISISICSDVFIVFNIMYSVLAS